MIVYVIIYLVIIVVYLATSSRSSHSRVSLGVMMLGLALFVGCADMLGGYDRYIYGEVFDQISLVTHNNGDILATAGYRLYSSEWGFLLFNQAMAYITLNRYVFILTLTLIVYLLLYISISRYCRNYPFAVIVFMGLWFFFTFTYLRQVMAASIGWLAVQYVIERKPLRFFLIVFIAYTFHNSAIVLVPLYFLPIKKYNKMTIILVMMIALGIGTTNILGNLLSASDSFANASRISKNVEYIEEGSLRVAYLVEAILFTSLIFWRYDDFDDSNAKQIALMNMALMFCIILMLFVRSENGGRFSWYYMIGIIASVTHIATHPTHKTTALTGGLAMMFIVLFLRILLMWGILLSPYKSFLSNGHREGDVIYQIYEYDPKYDIDKFYK